MVRVWQPMMKMICMAPNCLRPIWRRDLIAIASLAQKTRLKMQMLTMAQMFEVLCAQF